MARLVLTFHVEGSPQVQRHIEALVALQLSALPHVHSVSVKDDATPGGGGTAPAMYIAA